MIGNGSVRFSAIGQGRLTARFVTLQLVLTLAGAPHTAARIELDATLEPGQVVPIAPPANPQAGGFARFTLEDDGMVRWELQVNDLTGFATGTYLRQGSPGATGPVAVTLTNPPSTGTHVGAFGPLAPEVQARLFEGLWYVEVETGANPTGEIRGQVQLVSIADRTCACRGATTKMFRRCVKTQVRELPQAVRRTAAAKLVRRGARRAVCGPAPARPGRRVPCCLPWNPLANIVIERLCAPMRERACTALGGVPSAAPSCFVDGACTTASPGEWLTQVR
jgi:hypothetical protein